MSDDTGAPARNSATDPEPHARYRAVSAETFEVDDELAILTSELWPGAVAIRTESAAVLRHCLPERPLIEHADKAARALGLQGGRELDTVVESLANRQLLRRVEPSSAAASPSAAIPSASIRTIAIVTADRPGYLARCLGSYLERLTRQSPDLRVIVVDESREPHNRRETERHARLAAASAHLEVEYAGEASRQSLHALAVAGGIAPHVVDWLMPAVPPARSAGGGRNHLLLLTAGEPVLMVDDDTVCTWWRHEEADEQIAFVGHIDPNDTNVFQDRRAAVSAIHEFPGDPLTAHQTLLGRRLAELAEGSRDLSGVCRHLMPVFDGLRPAWTVRATWTGLAGDAGTNSPYPLLFSSGPTRARLAADGGPGTALASREVVRSVRRPTVTDEPWFMTYCAAVDGTALLPPFSPVGTNEDGLFGAMLRICDPTAFVGQIPYGIVHDSNRTSLYGPDLVPSAVRLADLVQWLLAPWAAVSVETDVSDRIHGLGRHLIACGQLESKAWRAFLTRSVVDARRRLLIATDAVLESGFPYSPAWRDAIRRYQQGVLDSVTSADACVPAEYRSLASADAAFDAVQTYVGQFGEALIAWPELWALCRTGRKA